MAKKKKRARARREKAREVRTTTPSPAQPAFKPPVKAPERPSPRVDFRREYPYVYSDLRRAGITALVMFMFMLALSLIIH